MDVERELQLGPVRVGLQLQGDALRSLGSVHVGTTPLRNPHTRFLPWFDTFAGDVFNQYLLQDIVEAGDGVVVKTRAIAACDYPFREQRDCSGDLVFRNRSWDASPAEAALDIIMADQFMRAEKTDAGTLTHSNAAIPWFNPHEAFTCTGTPRGQVHQLLSSGPVQTFAAARYCTPGPGGLYNMYITSWGQRGDAYVAGNRAGPANTPSDGWYFRSIVE